MLTQKELAAIRERAEKATPGPWETRQLDQYSLDIVSVPEQEVICCTDSFGQGARDGHFIAHAREDIPRLLDALEAAYERERRLIDALRWYAKTDNWTEGRLIRIEYPEIVVSVAEEDGGQHARATLKELGIEKESDAE